MIVLNSLSVREFRGIRKLDLQLGGKSFAVCGPNGTGKSGIVDAVEFVLTGSISRLGGEGRGDLSVLQHAPHVDSRDNPERAVVTAEVFIPALKTTATITRSVKHYNSPTITPDSPEIVEAMAEVAAHPESVLSRREIIRYVLATPGKRAEEVSALLHLDRLNTVRQALQKIANAAVRTSKNSASATNEAKSRLLAALELEALTGEGVLQAANIHRATLGLAPLTVLTGTTALTDGVQSGSRPAQVRVRKLHLQNDIKRIRTILQELQAPVHARALGESRRELDELRKEPHVIDGVRRDKFIRMGLDLIEGAFCPFCDTPWDLEELKARVAKKAAELELIARRKESLEKKLEPALEVVTRLIEALVGVHTDARRLPKPLDLADVAKQRQILLEARSALEDIVPIQAALSGLDAIEGIEAGIVGDLNALEQAVSELPEASAGDVALQWLTISQERLEAYRVARRREQREAHQAKITKQTFEVFASTADAELTRIYAKVAEDFAGLYAAINADDESGFQASLKPSASKLGFGVDFYGKGLFPPGAYHSEGHQDGMGLCLYLALMRYLQGDGFRLAVLDDVLMSVDVGHRREVCKVLKAEFPNTQFIFTTHDRIWMNHMRTAGLIQDKAGLIFRSWDVEHGPTDWESDEVWDEIEGHLKRNDVHASAGVLRRYLEYVSAELCHELRAPVEFRSDEQYELGQLLPAAVGKIRALLRNGKSAAHSWKDAAEVARIAGREDQFVAAFNAAEGDRWQVNATIHFNSWDNLTPHDFRPVVTAMRQLLAEFSCPQCGGSYRLSPPRGEPEALRCDCGKDQINLRRGRPKEDANESTAVPADDAMSGADKAGR